MSYKTFMAFHIVYNDGMTNQTTWFAFHSNYVFSTHFFQSYCSFNNSCCLCCSCPLHGRRSCHGNFCHKYRYFKHQIVVVATWSCISVQPLPNPSGNMDTGFRLSGSWMKPGGRKVTPPPLLSLRMVGQLFNTSDETKLIDWILILKYDKWTVTLYS